MACISSALIVGGGIAGLSTSIALARAGVACVVVERGEAALGASLGISGRAAEALDALGVYEECYANATPWTEGSTAATMHDATGKQMGAGPQRPKWPGAKTAMGIYRPVLITALQGEAARLGVSVRSNLSTREMAETAAGVDVTFTDGAEQTFDLVIGADGIWSQTRAQVFPESEKPAYAGQMSIRWMAPGPPIEPEGWFFGPVGRLGFYYLPQGVIYVPAVLTAPDWVRQSDEEVHALFRRLLDSYTAPSIVALRERLTPESELICRPFEWVLLPKPWFRGRRLLIGDAAHATTAHMGMGGGMALEDAVVLGQCVERATSLPEALESFMERRFDRVRTVVETSVGMCRLEQRKAPPSENVAMMSAALQTLAQPY